LAEVTIPLRSHDESVLVLGPYDRHAKLMRQAFDIEVYERNGNLKLKGTEDDVIEARRRVDHLLGKLRKGRELSPHQAEEILVGPPRSDAPAPPEGAAGAALGSGGGAGYAPALARTRAGARTANFSLRPFEPRTEHQRKYVESIRKRTLTFGLGVAGTGKTYLAVASALAAMRAGECRRLIVSRPVVEAGEKLGFLPGDVQAKLNPYMRPVYDALGELLEFEDVSRLEEVGVIEVAPLAYMRGRTLSHAFVILDEAQNTTVGQMKMVLTRLGEGSRLVVTGDPSQNDLEDGRQSGLEDAVRRLKGIEDIGIVRFTTEDICRHPLVEQIVRAYEPR
jgi:phosphate starvation-inducible PhoH-like protein